MISEQRILAPIGRLAALPGRAVVTGLSLLGGLTYYGLIAAWLAGVLNPAAALGWPAVFTAVLMLAAASMALDRGDRPWFRLDVAPELYRGEVAQNMLFLVIALLPLALLMIVPTRTLGGPIVRRCRPLIRSLLGAIAAVIRPVGRLAIFMARWAVGALATASRFWCRVGLTIGSALGSALSLVVTWLGTVTIRVLTLAVRAIARPIRMAIRIMTFGGRALVRAVVVVVKSLAIPAGLLLGGARVLAHGLGLVLRAGSVILVAVLRPLGFVTVAVLGLIAAVVGTVASDVSSLGHTVSRWLRNGASLLVNSRRTVPVPFRVIAGATLAIGVLYVNWSTVIGLLPLRRADALVAFLAALSAGS